MFSEEELILIDNVREEYRRLVPVPCTNCKYCMPCPNGVEIASILEYYNDAIIYDNPRAPRFLYRNLSKDKQANNCVECFECEEKCPQGIPIPEQLKEACFECEEKCPQGIPIPEQLKEAHSWLGKKK
jgi:predicted aldo/keto reductase-like oxidoreductase